MKIFEPAIAIAVIILFVSSCAENRAPDNEKGLMQLAEVPRNINDKKEEQEFYSDSTATQTDPGNRQQPSEKLGKQDWDKKIIKTASLNFEVKDYKAYYLSLLEKVRNAGGYIAGEEQTQSDYKIENNLIIKVPVDQFDNAVNLFTNNIERLNEKKITSQDVSAEYVDTRSRMEAKKQVRLRYLDLLKQARNMEEILSVQSEINGIQEQIESGQGRIEFLNHSSVFSTINLTYYQILNSSGKNDDTLSLGSKIGNAFKAGWSFTESLFVALISIWPVYFIVAVLLFAYKRVKPKQA